MNIRVKFSLAEEFLDELRKDGATGDISRNIVRATAEYVANNMTPMIKMVFIVATYRCGDEVIELRRLCGDHWVDVETAGNDETMKKYELYLAQVEEFCNRHGLDLRAGIYERMESHEI